MKLDWDHSLTLWLPDLNFKMTPEKFKHCAFVIN